MSSYETPFRFASALAALLALALLAAACGQPPDNNGPIGPVGPIGSSSDPATPYPEPTRAPTEAPQRPQATSEPTQRPQAHPGCTSACTFDTDDLTVATGAGWQLEKRDAHVIALTTAHGELTLGDVGLPTPQSPAELLQEDLANARKLDSRATICEGPQAMPIPNGPPGQVAAICYTYPSVQGSPSFRAVEIWFEAVNGSGTIEFAISLFMPESSAQAFVQEAMPVIRTVRWKRYAVLRIPSPDVQYPPHQQLCLPLPNGTMQCTP